MKTLHWLTRPQFAHFKGISPQRVHYLLKHSRFAKKYLKVVGGITFIRSDANYDK